MKKIIFLTDLNNGEEEDILTIKYLRKYYIVDISYIDLSFNKLFNYDLIILRNTWPNNEEKFFSYNFNKKKILDFIEKNTLKVYNELKSDFDRKGKSYLVNLYNKGYNVIPTFSDFRNIPNNVNDFILKPLDGFSSYGQRKISKNELSSIDFANYIIQPKLEFKYEISFYFIDNNFLYSLIFSPSKIPKWPKPIVHNPTKEELSQANFFLSLDKMKKGVSRIDFLRLNNGELKLLEIEDDSPYFSITEIPKNLYDLYLLEFKSSIDNFFK